MLLAHSPLALGLSPGPPHRTMVTQLLRHERIETTLAKAKVLRQYADRMINLGKKDCVETRRAAQSFVRGQPMINKIFSELAERYRYVTPTACLSILSLAWGSPLARWRPS